MVAPFVRVLSLFGRWSLKISDMMVSTVLETEDERRFRTFENYFSSIALLCKTDHGTSRKMVAKLQTVMNVKQTKASCDREKVAMFLRRAWATELLMMLPLTRPEFSAIVSPSILWLPVQSYYAVYSALQAAFISENTPIETHTKSISHFSENMRHRMPYPFHCVVSGRHSAISYERFRVEPETDFSTLARPQHSDDACHILATALRNTRTGIIDEKCTSWKTEHSKQRTPPTIKAAFGDNEAPTSVLHLLYKLRVRSNYKDSDVFLLGSTDQDSRNFAKSYITVVDYFIGALEVFADKRLGGGFVAREAAAYKKETDGELPVSKRWSV